MSGAPSIWAVVPVKPFAVAKRRLAPVLSQDARRGLARAMLEDVLDALQLSTGLAGVLVVTQDAEARRIALARGVTVLDEGSERGLNKSVAVAARTLAGWSAAGMLVVAGDLPAIDSQDVEALLELHRKSDGVSIAPDRYGIGTNALLLTPPDVLPTSFGEDSFARHLAAAKAAGLHPMVLKTPGFSLDIDRPEDIEIYLQRRAASRTWRYLDAVYSSLEVTL